MQAFENSMSIFNSFREKTINSRKEPVFGIKTFTTNKKVHLYCVVIHYIFTVNKIGRVLGIG